jgi:hypothetical protein
VRNRIRWSALALITAATAVAVAACGGGGKNGGATPVANASGQRGGFQAYATCLSQHGVNLPQFNGSRGPRGTARPSARPSGFPTARPSGGGNRFGFGDQPPPGVDQATWDKARQACAALLPSAGPGAGQDNSAVRAYRTCLADHGVQMNGRQDQLNTADPKVAQALQVCAPLRPSPRQSG